MEWMPIETAPRDVEVLLCGEYPSGNLDVRKGRYLNSRWPFVGSGQPVHWMPLTDRRTPEQPE